MCVYQVLVDCDTDHLAKLLKCSKRVAAHTKDAAQRYLDKRREVQDALGLLDLIARVKAK